LYRFIVVYIDGARNFIKSGQKFYRKFTCDIIYKQSKIKIKEDPRYTTCIRMS